MASTRNKTCLLDVAQEHKAYKQGLGVTFHQVNMSASILRVSTDLTIKFSTAKGCAQSSIWKLDNYDNLRGRFFVTIEVYKASKVVNPSTICLELKKRKMIMKLSM